MERQFGEAVAHNMLNWEVNVAKETARAKAPARKAAAATERKPVKTQAAPALSEAPAKAAKPATKKTAKAPA